jgi:glycerol kinase
MEFKQYFPNSGWVEHDAQEIWETQLAVARRVMYDYHVHPSQIAAIGITNQRETTVIWDRVTGLPIHQAIVWQDRRTANMCDELKDHGWAEKIQAKTGLILDAYFSASKVQWLLDHVPEARMRAEQGELAFGTIDSWILWNLTGGQQHYTDVSNASRTMLFNIHTMDWDAELLELFRIPRALLPQVRSNSEVYSQTKQELFGVAIPIAGMAGDQQAALFGQMCVEAGMVKNTYGTGCFILANTGAKPVTSKNKLLTTVAWKIGDETTYALEGSVFLGGAVVQWIRDGLELIQHASEVEALAKTVSDNGGVYLVPAFTGLGAPHWDQYARGLIIGLSRGTTKGHIARAALEAICYQSKDVMDAMVADSGIPIKQIRVDGGATANDFLMQLQSDVMDSTVIRPTVLETTALGAAYFAGLAVGFWESLEQLQELWNEQRTFQKKTDMSRSIHEWKRAAERSKNWIEKEN